MDIKKYRNNTEISQNIYVPLNRYKHLKKNWQKLIKPLILQLKLFVRINLKLKQIEIRFGPETEQLDALTRAINYVRAFILGFEIKDALTILRLNNIFLDSFEITDVRRLNGDHKSRAIG